MILQELVKYYERAKASDSVDLAPIGLEWKEINFAIVIDRDGNFINLEDLRSDDKKARGRRCLVPQGIKRSTQIAAQPLWDKASYVLGCESPKKDGKQTKKREAVEEHEAFKLSVREIHSQCTAAGLGSVCKFLETKDMSLLKSDQLWEEVSTSPGNLSFRLEGEQRLICELPEIHRIFQAKFDNSANDAVTCLLTGEPSSLARLHPAIKGVVGGQSSGGSIVSFNQDAFRSYGKEQGANAPIGQYAATAYTTVLNSLLDKNSKQKLLLADITVVFWSSKKSKQNSFENVIFDLFGDYKRDDPNAYTELVKSVFVAPNTGAKPFLDDDNEFFVLGLAPNSARISIRLWHASTIKEIAANITQYFEDIQIARPGFLPEFPTLVQLMQSTALRSERKNIQPQLTASILKAILDGSAFPHSLASAVIRRIRSEPGDGSGAGTRNLYYRVALLKAYLNRMSRFTKYFEEKPMAVELDEDNRNIGYNLGRLFAVLEKIQGDALGDINATIRDRYYGAASATPVTCFPRLMRLKNHHLAKINNKGLAINHEKKLTEIVSNIRSEFPSHLSMADQGRFAIGYYHQRQVFFTPKNRTEQEEI